MATGDDVYIPKVAIDKEGRISVQNLNEIIRRIFQGIYALEGRTSASTIRDDLTVQGSVTAESLSAEPFTLVYDKVVLSPPDIPDDVLDYAPDGYGTIWRLTTSNAFGISIQAIVPNPKNVDGLRLLITNVSSSAGSITLINQSLRQYQIVCVSGDLLISPGGMAFLWWSEQDAVWYAAPMAN